MTRITQVIGLVVFILGIGANDAVAADDSVVTA